MRKRTDNRLRISCTGCGQRFKVPHGMPGMTFTCPHCKNIVIAPLDPNEVEGLSLSDVTSDEAPRKYVRPRHTDAAFTPTAAAAEAAEASATRQQAPPIDRLSGFLLEEQKRVNELASQVVKNRRLSPEEKQNQLKAIRHQKAVSIRGFVDTLMREVNAEIAMLRDSPASDTTTGKNRLGTLEREREGVILYLKVMFQMRTVGQDDQTNGATPGTP